MKRNILFMLILVISSILFNACTKDALTDENGKTNKVYFPSPEKIVFYKDGNTQTITKDNKVFSEIVIQMNSRISSNISTSALMMDKKSMDNIKKNETVVEFVYANKQKTKFNVNRREYNSLIFPLTGEYSELCFLETGTDSYNAPIGKIVNPGTILKYVK